MGLGSCDLVLPVDLQQVPPGGARFTGVSKNTGNVVMYKLPEVAGLAVT